MKSFLYSLLLHCFITGCSQQKPTQLKVMTFNVRIDSPSDSLNNWKYRKDSICEFIHKQDFDILGLQEVYHSQLKDLKQCLSEYSYIGVGRIDGKTQGEHAPVFYKKDRFTLLENSTFWISEYPDSAGTRSWDSAFSRNATWVRLKDNVSGKNIIVLNTHLDHVGKTARYNGVSLILERMKEIAGNDAVIATGDFNFPEQEKAYELMTTNEFIFRDTHKIAERCTGVDFTFHDFGRSPENNRKKIDYIFVTPTVKAVSSHIPFVEIAKERYLSDHNPVIAELEME